MPLNIPPNPYLVFNAPFLELPDNKLLLAGTISNNSTSSLDIILLRFSKNGEWDTDFNGNGIKNNSYGG